LKNVPFPACTVVGQFPPLIKESEGDRRSQRFWGAYALPVKKKSPRHRPRPLLWGAEGEFGKSVGGFPLIIEHGPTWEINTAYDGWGEEKK